MFPALQALGGVDGVVVDRLRWWRLRREESLATVRLFAPPSHPCRHRSHSAPVGDAGSGGNNNNNDDNNNDSSNNRGRLFAPPMPPRDVVELRHPPLLIVGRAGATSVHRDRVQMSLREVEGAVRLARLLPAERDMYAGRCGRCGRAASAPALPPVSLGLRRARRRAQREGRRNADLPSNKSAVALPVVAPTTTPPRTPPTSSSSHLCRKISCLQDHYVCNPEADFVGDGAFSRVFRAVPLFRGISSVNFLAMKVIPRRRLKKSNPTAPTITVNDGKKRDNINKLYPVAGGGTTTTGTTTHCKASAYNNFTSEAAIPEGVENLDAMHSELVEIEREISIIRSLRHTGCSQFVEALRTPNEFVIVMNMGRGSMDARRYLQLYGPPPEARVALIIFQLVKTVAYLQYTYGLIHRDIKLENVLLSRSDASRDRIREVLDTYFSAQHRESEDNMREDSCHAKTEMLEFKRSNKDSKKQGRRLSSIWGSRSSAQGSDDVERLLKVTLIDFGLARRTTKRGDKYKNNGHSLNDGRTSKTPGNMSSSNRHLRMGMPTPLPSAVNMFVSVDTESGSCASSTACSPSETSVSSANGDDEDDYDDTDIDEKSTTGEGKNLVSALAKERATTDAAADLINAEVAAGEGSTDTSITSFVATTAGPLSLMGDDGEDGDDDNDNDNGDNGGADSNRDSTQSLQNQFQETGKLEEGTMLTAAVDLSIRSGGDSTHHSAHLMPLTTGALLQTPSITPYLVNVEPGESNSRSGRDENQDDGETSLFLTPCGTDKYLPPEMLSWIVSHGGQRKPTTLRVARQLDVYAIGIVAYVLLSGCFPFNGASRASMAQQQQRCTPKCNSKHWRHISMEAISFVQSLLEPNPELRSTVAEALEHPWLRRAAHMAKKLLLVPESVEEMLMDGRTPMGTRTRGMEARNYSPHMQQHHQRRQQQDTPVAGRRTRSDHFSYVDSGCLSQRSTNHDNIIYHSSRTSVKARFVAPAVDSARGGGTETRQRDAEKRKPPTTANTNPTNVHDDAKTTVTCGALPPSASSPTPSAASLLAQIAAMRKGSPGGEDITGKSPSTSTSRAAEGKDEAEEDGSDDGDFFKRMFKSVMSEQ